MSSSPIEKIILPNGDECTFGGSSGDALLKTTFIPEFSDTDKYVPGQLVYHNGTAYECINVHEGAWDDNDFGWAWDEAFFKQLLITNFVVPYSDSTTYNKGEYTMLSNQLVMFNEDWDPNDPNSNFNVRKVDIKEALTQQISVGSLLGIQPYTSSSYDKYAMVLYSGGIYYSEVDNNTKSPDEGDWSSISYRTLLLIKYINENFNYSAFVDNKQYYKNDIVEKNDTLFKFNQNYSGSWDESKVDLYPDYNGSDTLNQFHTLMFNKKVLESSTKIDSFDPDVSYGAGTLVYNYNRLILKLESAYTANTPSSFNATEATFEEIIAYISSGGSSDYIIDVDSNDLVANNGTDTDYYFKLSYDLSDIRDSIGQYKSIKIIIIDYYSGSAEIPLIYRYPIDSGMVEAVRFSSVVDIGGRETPTFDSFTSLGKYQIYVFAKLNYTGSPAILDRLNLQLRLYKPTAIGEYTKNEVDKTDLQIQIQFYNA